MRLRTWVATLLVVGAGVAAAGCTAGENAPGGDMRDAWQADADRHGPMGVAASVDLDGSSVFVQFAGSEATWSGDFSLAVEPLFPRFKPFVYFGQAVVEGVGTGLLVTEGAELRVASAGTHTVSVVSAVAGGDVRAQPLAVSPRAKLPSAAFPDAWDDANASFFFSEAVALTLDGVVLSGFDRAVLLGEDGSAVDVVGDVTLSAPMFWWESESAVVADAIDVEAERFALGGNVTQGSIVEADGSSVEDPVGVFGHDGTLRLTPGRVASVGTVQVTQALTDAGYAYDAVVELAATTDVVEVAAGESAWVAVNYRDSSYVGDAVLERVTVTGPGADLVQVPVERPPLLIQHLWEVLETVAENATWMAPFFALPIAFASPVVILVDFTVAVVCAFASCPEQHPYPAWMEAGDVGVFYFQVDAAAVAPGAYPATVAFEGANHDAVSVDVTITVT